MLCVFFIPHRFVDKNKKKQGRQSVSPLLAFQANIKA